MTSGAGLVGPFGFSELFPLESVLDVLPSMNEGDSFLPTPRTENGDGSAGLKGQAADSEVFASEQALRACPALRIFLAALASAFSA